MRAERHRIARELHDVVAHHISVITVLMGAARTTVLADPGKAQETLLTAERTARAAMAEMRQLLHVLRAEDGAEPENQAGIGTSALPELVEQAARAGLPARLEVTGDAVALPSAVDHAIYRIVQESLTNTRKHARGARSSVRLAYLPDAVEVEVLDDGPGAEAPPTGGFGLGGMAERVALSGGELRTGPRQEGGFGVHARFPLPGAADLGAGAQPGA
ncbi:sensor histidine kinase [Streptosporangium lutulentum]